MPRKLRIEFEGAFYHVIMRGNQRQKVFRSSADHQKYLQLLTIYKNRYHFSLYAYVLMSNHVHLLLETGAVPLSKILQGANQSYTMYFIRTHRTVGHLFQGRYKAILCDRETYLLGLLKYIHENPVRARITRTAGEYAWSSHHAYAGRNNPLGVVSADQVLRLFSENRSRARRKYLDFMGSGERLDKGRVYATVDQRIQGDEVFVDAVTARTEEAIKREPRRKARTLEAIGAVIGKRYEVSLEHLRSASKAREIMQARRVFSQTAKAYGYQGREIARYLRKDPASVTGYLHQEAHDRAVAAMVRLLEASNVNSKA